MVPLTGFSSRGITVTSGDIAVGTVGGPDYHSRAVVVIKSRLRAARALGSGATKVPDGRIFQGVLQCGWDFFGAQQCGVVASHHPGSGGV